MMKILGFGAMAFSAALMAGCQERENRVAYDGQFFRAKAKKVDKQRDTFVVTVTRVSKSLDGAREAAYHSGVSYCLASFGSSDIIWVQNPLDKDARLSIEKDTLRVRGRCPQAQDT